MPNAYIVMSVLYFRGNKKLQCRDGDQGSISEGQSENVVRMLGLLTMPPILQPHGREDLIR